MLSWVGQNCINRYLPIYPFTRSTASNNVQIPLGWPDYRFCRRPGSGRVLVRVVKFGRGRDRLCRWSGLVVLFLNSTTRTHGLHATRPDQTHGQSPYVSRLSGQVYDQTKSADLSETRAVLESGLGRVRVVEFRSDTTRPDQRQSLARNLDTTTYRRQSIGQYPPTWCW